MPNADIVFHPAASEEYAEALEWYAECGRELRESFEQEVERAIRLIAAAPERWPRYGRQHRRVLLRRFPYFIVYVNLESRIWVVAVAHGHRRPGFWRGRKIQA